MILLRLIFLLIIHLRNVPIYRMVCWTDVLHEHNIFGGDHHLSCGVHHYENPLFSSHWCRCLVDHLPRLVAIIFCAYLIKGNED